MNKITCRSSINIVSNILPRHANRKREKQLSFFSFQLDSVGLKRIAAVCDNVAVVIGLGII